MIRIPTLRSRSAPPYRFRRWAAPAVLFLLAAVLAGLAPQAARAQQSGAASVAVPPTLGLKALVDVEHRWEGKGEPGGFSLRRARLFAQGALSERLAFRAVLEPTVLAVGPAGAAPFRGVPLVELYTDYRAGPELLIRGGQQRLPFGLAASTGVPSLRTAEYPLATRHLVQRSTVFRDIGVSARGRLGRLRYGIGVFNGAGINVPVDNNATRDVLGHVRYALRPGWTVGVSGWRGRTGELYRVEGVARRNLYDNARFTRWGVDTRYARGPLTVTAEYLADRTEHLETAENPTPAGRPLERAGWNVMTAYRIRPDLDLAVRYDRWDPSRELAGDEVTEFTTGVSWYLRERAAREDERFGRPLNSARSHSRVMLFVEHQRPASAEARTRLRVRWELFH